MPTKKEKQPLSVSHPELAKEADGWDPSKASSSSQKKFSWVCPRGHKYIASIGHRTLSGSNCPYCSGNKVLAGFNDLVTTDPELAKEADGWDPTKISKGSSKKLAWKCRNSHHWNATVGSRSNGKTGCPYCANKKLLQGFNDLATTHPEIATQAYGWDPTSIVAGRSEILEWKCGFGHIWKVSAHTRTRNNAGCPVCINRQIIDGVNDLATTHPQLLEELNQELPSGVSAGSHKKLSWKCSRGHIYSAEIRSRALRGSGCGICANNIGSKYEGNLSESHPEIANEAFEWNPETATAGSGKNRLWKCKLGHIYTASPTSRVHMQSSCSICSNHKVLFWFNDLETLWPEIAREAYLWDPATVTPGSHKKREWKCNNGHIYEASPKSRVGMKSGCAICTNQKCLPGFNDLATTNPELSREAYGWDPSQVVAGYAKKLKWKCEFGHIWIATGHSRSRGDKTGCPTCAKNGFDPNAPAFLYFLRQPQWEMYQIGITNNFVRRMAEHQKNNWELLEIRGPMDGHLTQQWERAILRMLKAGGADLSNSKVAGKFDGYSEAWSKSTFEVKSVKELMRLTEEYEG